MLLVGLRATRVVLFAIEATVRPHIFNILNKKTLGIFPVNPGSFIVASLWGIEIAFSIRRSDESTRFKLCIDASS